MVKLASLHIEKGAVYENIGTEFSGLVRYWSENGKSLRHRWPLQYARRMGCENKGIAPNIEVEMEPKIVNQGRDPQLEKAVQTALDLLKKEEVKMIPQPADPVRVKRPKG